MARPDLSRVPEFYHNYIKKAPENDLTVALKNNTSAFNALIKTIPAEKHDYRYAEGKWTIKDLIQHIIDGERIFSYRALRFARKDNTPLPGFDENLFAANAKTGKRSWNEMIEEFNTVRKATELLFMSFDEQDLESSGVASDNSVYVLGLGFICAGHCAHHLQVLKERYL